MPQRTVSINLTDAELEAFNLLAALYEETQTESAESYICNGLRMWLENEDVCSTPKAKRLIELLRKEDKEAEKKEAQIAA